MGEEYTNERIMERILSAPEEKPFAVFQRTVYVKKQYRLPTREHKIKKVGGLKGLYLHYCYLLGYLPKYNQRPMRVSPLIRDDITKIEMISREARLIEREKLETLDDVAKFKASRQALIAEKTEAHYEEMKVLRRKVPEEEKERAREKAYELKEEIKELRKDVRLAERIQTRAKDMEEKINTIKEEEVKRDERRR